VTSKGKDIVLLYNEKKESMVIIHRWPSVKDKALDDLEVWVVSTKPNAKDKPEHKVVYNLVKEEIIETFESGGYAIVGGNVQVNE
jgi:hypothetical protein